MYKIRSFRNNKNIFIIIHIVFISNIIKKYEVNVSLFANRFLFTSKHLHLNMGCPLSIFYYYQLNGFKKTKIIQIE